jgi:hypothetical protein
VFLDKSTTRGQKVKKAIWGGIATAVLLSSTCGAYLYVIGSGYTDDGYGRAKFADPRLTIEMWFFTSMSMIVICLFISCLIEIIIDWFVLIRKFLKGESHGR